jgi:ATP-dependent helicase/nuclease subunit A
LPAADGKAVQRAEPEEHRQAEKPALPSDLSRPLPPQKILPRPLSPSGAGMMIDDDADDLIVTSPLFGDKTAGSLALQKGKLVHRMLQMLTEFSDAERETAAYRYAERAARYWPKVEREKLVDSVMSVLSHGGLAPVFSARSQAEVSIMGTLQLEGQDYAISGRIDRLVEMDDRVIILDYKTNRKPPAEVEAVPLTHRAQLAIYREILKPLYPGKEVECVLVYTETATVMTLPVELMSRSLAELKTK